MDLKLNLKKLSKHTGQGHKVCIREYAALSFICISRDVIERVDRVFLVIGQVTDESKVSQVNFLKARVKEEGVLESFDPTDKVIHFVRETELHLGERRELPNDGVCSAEDFSENVRMGPVVELTTVHRSLRFIFGTVSVQVSETELQVKLLQLLRLDYVTKGFRYQYEVHICTTCTTDIKIFKYLLSNLIRALILGETALWASFRIACTSLGETEWRLEASPLTRHCKLQRMKIISWKYFSRNADEYRGYCY